MSYSARAGYYASEFSVQEDFATIREALRGARGVVVDIPCGAGRLIPLHLEHGLTTLLVDLEPKMIAVSRDAIPLHARSTLLAQVGDIRTWAPPQLVDRILVSRGGLQMLPSATDVDAAIRNLAECLCVGGKLYFDLANAWSADSRQEATLPDFMRFGALSRIRGSSQIARADAGGTINRTFMATRTVDAIEVEFDYIVMAANGQTEDSFQANGRWQRVDWPQAQRALGVCGMTVEWVRGAYDAQQLAGNSARTICLAVKA